MREHSKSNGEAMNIVEECRLERVEWFVRKKKCPKCRVIFSIKSSLEEHLTSNHGWSASQIQKIVPRNKEPVWLCLSESSDSETED